MQSYRVFLDTQEKFSFIFGNNDKTTLSLLPQHQITMNEYLKFATSLLTDSAYLFIAGAIIFFYTRQRYILAITQALLGKDSTEYKTVNRKVKKLGWTLLLLCVTYALFIMPMFVDTYVSDFANQNRLSRQDSVIRCLIMILVSVCSIFIGGNTASWLVHDEDYKDNLKK